MRLRGGPQFTLEMILLGSLGPDRAGGAFLAYRAYIVNREMPKRVRESLGFVTRLVENKYYVDELYNMIVVEPLQGTGRLAGGNVRSRAASTGPSTAWPASPAGWDRRCAACRAAWWDFMRWPCCSVLWRCWQLVCHQIGGALS